MVKKSLIVLFRYFLILPNRNETKRNYRNTEIYRNSSVSVVHWLQHTILWGHFIKHKTLIFEEWQVLLRYSILASGTYCNSITYLLHIFATIEVVDTLSVPRVQTVQNTSILPHILPWHNYFLQQVDFRFQYTLYHGSVQIYDVKIILT